ncbi:MAG: hypothetical protein RQ830_08145 [Tepidimonas sp.]|nr:hypothetical protein [Tepidimonas sp.]
MRATERRLKVAPDLERLLERALQRAAQQMARDHQRARGHGRQPFAPRR